MLIEISTPPFPTPSPSTTPLPFVPQKRGKDFAKKILKESVKKCPFYRQNTILILPPPPLPPFPPPRPFFPFNTVVKKNYCIKKKVASSGPGSCYTRQRAYGGSPPAHALHSLPPQISVPPP